MKKTALPLALSCCTGLAAAQSWTVLPILDAGHQFKPTVALTAGSVNPDGGSDAGTVGLELSFNCGLIQSPDKRIRSYLQVSRSDKDGVKATAFELSPRYMLPVGNGLSIGAGPSLTAVRVDAGGSAQTVYGAGLAAGVDWRSGQFFAGADLRWHDTSEKSGVEFDSTAFAVKVGFNF